MTGSVNKAIIVGNLGADPEIRTFPSGNIYCNLRVATSERWKDRNTGENRDKSEWHNVTIYSEGLARVAEQYLRKGTKIYIEGKIETRKWQDQSGQDRYMTEIAVRGFGGVMVMLDRAAGGQGEGGRFESPPPTDRDMPAESTKFSHDIDDDIPF